MVVKHNITAMNSNRMLNITTNAQDGISCVQTAEGALNEVQDMLQRMNELSVKGENGTLTTTDRSYIQSEIKQLMEEVDRVQSTTTFNEKNLLDGTFKGIGLQVGAEAGQHLARSLPWKQVKRRMSLIK